MSAPRVGCSDCGRWYSTSGSPICGICRVSRAVHLLPADPRLNSENYDLVHSILERSLGEVNGWLSVPLGAPPGTCEEKSQAIEKEADLSSRQSSNSSQNHKDKRSSRDQERRDDRREVRRQPPPPPQAPRRERKEKPDSFTSSWKRSPGWNSQSVLRGSEELNSIKKGRNKGKKHRERGKAYWENRRASQSSSVGGLDGPSQEASGGTPGQPKKKSSCP